ncbi:hypothetical protein [Methanosphaera sp. BMS]|uniref:hypothetical protein n=1 Tax=Methanosphaera sp. BMS TaxID=1789762 RepID=UPI000DC1CA9E|nr:hypothetical protein [Methanosphaera sp. BMS]AWX32330.1 hypothetical protein AW729_04065 [Methanosphaera sp. BMS]
MDRKIVGIVVVILLVMFTIYAVLAYNSTYNAKIGASSVSIPDGFTSEHRDNGTVISNNETEYTLYELDKQSTLDSLIEQYHLAGGNYTIDSKTYPLGTVNLTSVTVKQNDNSVDTFYYYEKNEKVYKMDVKGKYNKTAMQTLVNTTTINPVPFI